MPFLGLHSGVASRLAGVVGFTWVMRAMAYSVPKKTDKFYDLAGSLGFVTTTLVSLFNPTFRSLFTGGNIVAPKLTGLHPRQLVISALYLLWAGRLGTFLFQRIQKHGKDSRFDDLKQDPKIFSTMWFGQAVWVTLVSLPVVLVNVLPASQAALGIKDAIGIAIWAAGFGLEIIADRVLMAEKSQWRSEKDDKKHDEQFISSGAWGLSRHPKAHPSYLGEFILQAGPPLVAASVVPSPAAYMLPLSPIFTYVLLRYASGVPPLERSAEKKWGEDPKWRSYADKTSVFVPWPFGQGKGKA